LAVQVTNLSLVVILILQDMSNPIVRVMVMNHLIPLTAIGLWWRKSNGRVLYFVLR
jgi:hypothetical protein